MNSADELKRRMSFYQNNNSHVRPISTTAQNLKIKQTRYPRYSRAGVSALKRYTLKNRASVISRTGSPKEIDNGLDFQLHQNEKKPFHEFDTFRGADKRQVSCLARILRRVCRGKFDRSRITAPRDCI